MTLPRFAREPGIDFALVYQLMDRDRPCCRCAAADHDEHGCRGCWPRCRRSYADHPAREDSEAVEAWREAGSALAMWTREWCREDPPEDQSRASAIAGELLSP